MNKVIALLGLVAIAIAIVAVPTAISYNKAADEATVKYQELVDQAQANFEGYNIVKTINTKNVAQIDTLTSDVARLNNNITNLDTDVQNLLDDTEAQQETIKDQASSILVLQEHAKVYFKGVDSLRTDIVNLQTINTATAAKNHKLAKEYKILHKHLEETQTALNIAHKKEADRKKIFN